jgi:hypothetical protein
MPPRRPLRSPQLLPHVRGLVALWRKRDLRRRLQLHPARQRLQRRNLLVLGSVFPKVEKIAVNKGNCRALARHMKTEIERIIAASIAYSPRRDELRGTRHGSSSDRRR